MASNWFLYIIETKSGKLYTGITTDIDRRFDEHKKSKTKRAKFFRSDPPKKIVYREEFTDRSSASKREAEIKALNRTMKLRLISQQ